MVDISITASSVANGGASEFEKKGVAGAAITAGEALYIDTANSNVLKLAQDDGTTLEATVAGISLCDAAIGQLVVYLASGGTLTINAVGTAGETYIVSATAGGIAPIADISTNIVSYIGYGISTTSLKLNIVNTGVTHA